MHKIAQIYAIKILVVVFVLSVRTAAGLTKSELIIYVKKINANNCSQTHNVFKKLSIGRCRRTIGHGPICPICRWNVASTGVFKMPE
jgi:hypothetical protein